MSTLVLDCGVRCVGLLKVEQGIFKVVHEGPLLAKTIEEIQSADEVVTYNGTYYDLKQLGKFAGLDGPLPLNGRHSDMQRIRWDPILGSSLTDTYKALFAGEPAVDQDADEYAQSIQSDVMMTFELWKLWKAGLLPTCQS
jgi:hypothetical protein